MNALLAPLAIFSGPYGVLAKWGVIGLLVAAVGGFLWIKGDEHGTQKLLAYQATQALASVRVAKAREVVTTQVVDHYIKVKGDTQTVTQTIEKEVIKYADANPGYCLDAGWRVRHDAAALNTVPAAGFVADGAGGAPKAAEALDTVTGNYAACNRTADRLDALQAWVKNQAAVR